MNDEFLKLSELSIKINTAIVFKGEELVRISDPPVFTAKDTQGNTVYIDVDKLTLEMTEMDAEMNKLESRMEI